MTTVNVRVNIREKRLQRGWTLDELAKQCEAKGAKTAISNLHRIETNKQVPRPRLRAVLAGLLDVDVADFDTRPADGALRRGTQGQGRKNNGRPKPQRPKPPKGGSKQGPKGAPK